MGRKDLIKENIWGGKHLGGLNHMVGENIWGMKNLIDGKTFGE